MARIYIARTTGIGSFERHVVLKLITPERANDHTAVQMFLDEARLAASLNHQNVAQVFEVGEDAGIHYLAMEYVHGQDLRALLAKAGSAGVRVPLELALTTVAGAASGLNHAHERRDSNGVPLGIVHRDVSPSNIMIGLDGSVKLLDFGIAKATQRSVETVSGIIKGKFAYMAPEQCRGRDVDRRSDVFSLGIILYEITTQHRCFRADSDFDTMHRIVTGDVVRPTRLVQGYPQALEAIVMKALAIDANQRYQSAGLLLEAIESFAVSGRMSLSTMALGRFMREMFGETQEPWLTAAGRNGTMSQPDKPKESTISNTNGSSEVSAPPRPSAAAQQPARTLLDLPRDHDEREPDDEPDQAEWNAKSYPTMVPGSYASAQTLQPENNLNARSSPRIPLPPPAEPVNARSSPRIPVPAESTPVPAPAAPVGVATKSTGGRPAVVDNNSSQQFPVHPGSQQSGPALAYPKLGTNQSGQSYVDDSLSNVRVRPNRRPLWIGLAIITIGIGLVLIVGYGGGNVEPKPEDKPNPTVTPGSDAKPVVDPPKPEVAKTPDAAPEDTVHLDITSEPSGADVWQAGKLLGKTPYTIDRARGTGDVALVVQHAGFDNVTLKVDTSGDYTKKVIMTKEGAAEVKPPTNDKPPTTDAPPIKPDKPPVTNVKPPVKPDKPAVTNVKPPIKPDKPPVKPEKPVVKPDKPPPQPNCQKPGEAMPFDPRPICKS